jgi:predicted ATP-grasp superfamily ATP-dependent carboligase
MTRGPTVLVAGFSARALARSALSAGYDVVALDGFGDRDLLEPAPKPAAHLLVQPFHPRAAARIGANLAADALAYTSNFENHPAALDALARGRALWGNSPAVLRGVRSPERVASALRAAGLPVPRLCADEADASRGAWMVKPRRSGGGRGIRTWTPDEPARRHEYVQEWIEGVPGSLVFLGDGRAALPLALTRQVIGDARFGGWGHCYVGSLLASRRHPLFDAQETLFASAVAAADALTAEFGLVGLNTVDFMARDGVAWPVEVNPRHSASVELIERELGTSLFPLHVEAVRGTAAWPGHDALGWAAVPGKAILYARRRLTMTGSDALLASADVADVSTDGTAIPAGAPVCTIFARADSGEACIAALAAQGSALLTQLGRGSAAA